MSLRRLPLLIVAAFLAGAAPAASDTGAPGEAKTGLQRAPKPIKRVPPRYPAKAVEKDIAGDAVVVLTIGEQGDVPTAVEIFSETPAGWGFGEAAADCVRAWTFAPGQAGRYVVTVKFRRTDWNQRAEPDPPLSPAPQPVEREPPVYPLLAFLQKREATIRLIVGIEDDGDVEGLAVLKTGDDSLLFGDPAADAVIEWEFPPGYAGRYIVEVPFTLDGISKGLVLPPDD